MNPATLDPPISSITTALTKLLDLQEDSPNNPNFESLISSLQDAHTALTDLRDAQQHAQTPAPSVATPVPATPPPLIAKFHPNLVMPFCKAIRSLEVDRLDLMHEVMSDIEEGMSNLDSMVSFHFPSYFRFELK